MKKIFLPTFEMNDQLVQFPSLEMYPHRIALDWDPSLATFYLDLADRKLLSNRLPQPGDIDLVVEVERRKLEIEKYDKFLGPNAGLSEAEVHQQALGPLPPLYFTPANSTPHRKGNPSLVLQMIQVSR